MPTTTAPLVSTIPVIVPLPMCGPFQLEWAISSPALDGLESDYQAARGQFDAVCNGEQHLQAFAEDDSQEELYLHGKGCDLHGRGGTHAARNPEVEHLARLAGTVKGRRWEGHPRESHLDVAKFSPVALAAEALRAHWHRGRRRVTTEGRILYGPTSRDYAFQGEWTRARSVGLCWFTRVEAFAYRLPSVTPAIGELVGNSLVRRTFLGMLLDAQAAGWLGLTISGPEAISFLGCALSTYWEAVAWLEARGLLVRLRRYKPGKDGRPVEYTSNWYGLGPAVLDVQERLAQGHTGDIRRVRRERLKVRARHRQGRQRHNPRVRPFRLAYVDRATWVAGELQAAETYRAIERQRLEVELAEYRRVDEFEVTRTWSPPPPEDTGPKPWLELVPELVERAHRVAAVVAELGEAQVLDEAERVALEIKEWRARTGPELDDIDRLAEVEEEAEEAASRQEDERLVSASLAFFGPVAFGLDDDDDELGTALDLEDEDDDLSRVKRALDSFTDTIRSSDGPPGRPKHVKDRNPLHTRGQARPPDPGEHLAAELDRWGSGGGDRGVCAAIREQIAERKKKRAERDGQAHAKIRA